MILAMLPFRACRYLGLLGSSTGNDAYYRFDTFHIADIRDIGHFKCRQDEDDLIYFHGEWMVG